MTGQALLEAGWFEIVQARNLRREQRLIIGQEIHRVAFVLTREDGRVIVKLSHEGRRRTVTLAASDEVVLVTT